MSDTPKKPRQLTLKGIASSKLSKNTTATMFLAKHRTVLDGQAYLRPLLDAYDSGALLPTPALNAIQSALMAYTLKEEGERELAKLRKPLPASVMAPKAYTVILYTKVIKNGVEVVQEGTIDQIEGYLIHTDKGELVVPYDEVEGRKVIKVMRNAKPARWQAETFQDAMRLADRRLYSREDSVYAIIRNNSGKPIDTRINRNDAMARSLPKAKAPATRRTTARSSTLKWHGKAKQSHSNFSRG